MSEEKVTTPATVAPPVAGPPVKKKLGRPRMKPVREPMERKGVSSTPLREDNAIELVYDEPLVYKRALSVFNTAQTKWITFVFESDHVKIIGQDNLGKVEILVTIDCTRVPHYYCAERSVATLNAKSVERVNKTIDKKCSIINIIVKHGVVEPVILLVVQNEILNMRTNQTIKILPVPPHEYSRAIFDHTPHALNFELSGASFKKLVTDAIAVLGPKSGRLTIQKVGAGPLTFSYATLDKNISSQCTSDDAGVIKLVSTLAEDDIFISSVQLDYLKPYAAIWPETARIFADTSRRLIIAGASDNGTINVKIAVTIVSSAIAPTLAHLAAGSGES